MKRTIRRLALTSSIALTLGGISSGFADDLIAQSTMNEKISDARRESQILSGFSTNPRLHSFTFAVVVDGARAVLDGSVPDDVARNLAEQIAMGVEGIEHVDNRISIDADTPVETAFEQGVSDSWITSKVKSSLMSTRGVDSLGISVTTVGGVVSLSGAVDSSAERELAVRVTQVVRGVKRVDADGLKVG